MDPEIIPGAVAGAIETAAHERAAEIAAPLVDAVMENAAVRIERAEDTAQSITDAALMTALGQRQTQLEEQVRTWRDALDNRLSEVANKLGSLEAVIAALPSLMAPQPAPILSTPPRSAEPPDTLTVTPEAVVESVSTPVEPAPRARKRIWM